MDREGYVTQVDESQVPGGMPDADIQLKKGTEGALETESEVQRVKHQDGQTKAVVMMNIYCIANTLQCVLYKIMSERGVDLLEYTFFRNATILIMAMAILWL